MIPIFVGNNNKSLNVFRGNHIPKLHNNVKPCEGKVSD